MNSQASWAVENRGAYLKCGPLEGYAGCTADGLNFTVEKWNGRPLQGACIFMNAGLPRKEPEPFEVAELYIRGNDFIGNYSYGGAQRIAPQVYWRASEQDQLSAVRLELVLSVHTELLESMPELQVTSLIHEAKLYHTSGLSCPDFQEVTSATSFNRAFSAEHLFVFRSKPLGLMYAQMVHPSDFVSAEVSFDGSRPLFLDATLFPEHLEKGVIRRGRICGWFMPAENDLQTAVELARQFVDEPLPLTT